MTQRPFTTEHVQGFALGNKGADSDTARDFAEYVMAVQEAYSDESLEDHWMSYCRDREAEALDL